MYDVAVIGAGVIGCAIARELSKYDADICVIEREEDVCCGTSKANSAIIHAVFDAVPSTLKARLNVAGNAMMDDLARDLDIPFTRNGSLVVCTKDQDSDGLNTLLARGRANGVPGLRILNETEAKEMEPNLSDAVSCALYAPTGGIVCPFHFTIALRHHKKGRLLRDHNRQTDAAKQSHRQCRRCLRRCDKRHGKQGSNPHHCEKRRILPA